MRNIVLALVVAVGVAAITLGVFLIYVPAGFITGGVCFVAAAYVTRYLEVQNADS